MTIEEIRAIIQVLLESGVAELEVQRGENRVWVRRAAGSAAEAVPPATTTVLVAGPGATGTPTVSFHGVAAPPPAPAAPEAQAATIRSPIVGTFYESPTPGLPPFVKPGDRVSKGQVLCIIESMKLMNEIEADVPGVIESRLVENGQPVEYGQALFTYHPA